MITDQDDSESCCSSIDICQTPFHLINSAAMKEYQKNQGVVFPFQLKAQFDDLKEIDQIQNGLKSYRQLQTGHSHKLLDLPDVLHLQETKGEDIKHFYILGKELGQGSYGVVKISQRNCQASNQLILQQLYNQETFFEGERQLSYAIKQQLIPELTRRDQESEQLELTMITREYQSLSKLDHPLIQELLEVFIDRDFIYFVNPFYTGGEVYDLMFESSQDEENDSKPLPENTVKIIIYQVLKVMSYLKQNKILHRDLKPENIMFESCFDPKAKDALKSFIKIIDFGYSLDLGETFTDAEKEEISPYIMGTFAYTAPEQIEHRNDFDKQFKLESDMWSVGVIIYFLVSGIHPFRAENKEELFVKIQSCDYEFMPNSIWQDISDDCQNLIEGLLEPNVSQRLSPDMALKHAWFAKQELSSLSTEVSTRL